MPENPKNNSPQPVPTDEARVVSVTPPKPQNPPTPPTDSVPPWIEQTPIHHPDDQCVNVADHLAYSSDPNTLEYWKTLAIQNGESCRAMVETIGKTQADMRTAIKQKNEAEKQLALERSRTAVVMPNDLLTLFTKCTTGKVRSITINFADNSHGQTGQE